MYEDLKYENMPRIIPVPSEPESPSEKVYVASTLNIQPTKLMNKRQWKLYTHDKQRNQLLRIESAFRKKYDDVELIELNFEVCPVLKNIHYHALYRMYDHTVHDMYSYFKKPCCSQDEKTKIPWRFMVNKIIPKDQVKGWLYYIRKDLEKTQ